MCYGTVFALFYCEFEGNFQVQAPGGSYLEGDLTECFLHYEFGGGGGGGVFFGGTCTWRGLYFRDFTVIYKN